MGTAFGRATQTQSQRQERSAGSTMERVVGVPLTISATQMREPCLERNVTPLYRADTIGETPMLVPAVGWAGETVVHEARESLRAPLAAICLGVGREGGLE